MLTLTRKTEYALIAISHLARVGRQIVSARDIAEEHTVPLPLLMNVLKKLNRAGYINSVRGARGGYLLATNPEELTLADLIEAVEGPVHLTRCTNTADDARVCGISSTCPIRRSLVRVHQRLHAFLRGVTVAEIAHDHPASAELNVTKVLAK
ncbi:MAG: Rrf2 family transcriptional regulator [Phycisphaerales bacterium]|nr:Rrf2 family transcriptional regulator [Phycisphaerales bacterium]